jgi:hypothetical protein
VARIRAEMELQVKAASLNLAPKITSNWNPNGSHRCFAMERMNKTLEDVLTAQDNTLTVKQAKRILNIYISLGRDLSIIHNDPNITRNLMTNRKGIFCCCSCYVLTHSLTHSTT